MKIKFKNFDTLELSFDNNLTVDHWKKLFVKNITNNGLPMCRDVNKYTLAYLNECYSILCDKLGWKSLDLVSIENTVIAHKNLEILLADGFENIPAELDELVHDFHYGLHIQEKTEFSTKWTPRPYIQLEWFNNDYLPLDQSFEFKTKIEVGDLRLQNAYVGHVPLQIYAQNDYHNVEQTCRFHDRIKPGLWIQTRKVNADIDIDNYKNWWIKNAPEFVEKHGMEKILYYTGDPVIGKVNNLDLLDKLTNTKHALELENIYIND